MTPQLNLFTHSPKELTTDAFITWLFYFLDCEEVNPSYQQNFFNHLILKSEDQNKTVTDISVTRQEKSKNGRCDLKVHFILDQEEKTVLFENKTKTTTSNKQLHGYKIDHPNLYQYVYLKLGYVFYEEKKLAKNHGYKIIDVKKLVEVIQPLVHLHSIIEHYFEYIKVEYHIPIKAFDSELIEKNNYKLLKEPQAQQFFFSHLQEKMESNYQSFYYISGANKDGTPWSYLNFLEYANIYNSIPESIFWRMDKRKGEYYLRLSLYSGIKGTGGENLEKKKERVKEIREFAIEIADIFPALTKGLISNKGTNEMEIVIFFLYENRIDLLLETIPDFSKYLSEKINNSPILSFPAPSHKANSSPC